MNFKTKKEKTAALRALPDEPNGPVDNIEAWQAENAQKRKEIEDAVVEETSQTVPQEPPKEPPVPKQEPPKVEDVLSFNLKREELPEELRGYKNSDEIIKQFGHARSYANKAQSQLEALAAEKEALAAERAALAKQNEEAQKELQQIREQLKKPQQGTIDELELSLKEFEGVEGTEMVTVEQTRKALKRVSDQIKNIVESANKEITELKTKVTNFENVTTKTSKELEEKRIKEAQENSIKELLEKCPELKAKKPIYGTVDCVENDIMKFTNKVLSGLYNIQKPEWQSNLAVLNAYLDNDPEIKKYCIDNAITPESIGGSEEDIKKYAIVSAVDHRVKGLRVKENGTVEPLVSKITLKPVTYSNHIEAYESWKREKGITEQQTKQAIADAERRAAVNLQNAISTRAPAPALGSLGEVSPEDAGPDMTNKQAQDIMNMPGLEDKLEMLARSGDRSLFDLRNRALKHFKQTPFDPDPSWPPEKKKA